MYGPAVRRKASSHGCRTRYRLLSLALIDKGAPVTLGCRWVFLRNGKHIVLETPPDNPTVENAYRDIDRYVSEISQPSSNDARLLSPSQRLYVLGQRGTGLFNIRTATEEKSAPLLPSEP
jgi:hypothetical protein